MCVFMHVYVCVCVRACMCVCTDIVIVKYFAFELSGF